MKSNIVVDNHTFFCMLQYFFIMLLNIYMNFRKNRQTQNKIKCSLKTKEYALITTRTTR